MESLPSSIMKNLAKCKVLKLTWKQKMLKDKKKVLPNDKLWNERNLCPVTLMPSTPSCLRCGENKLVQ